jgi:hypothetical protein
MLSIHILADKRKVPEVGTTADVGNKRGPININSAMLPASILAPKYPIGELTPSQYAID